MAPPRHPDEAARDAWAAYRRLHLLVEAEVARDLERDCGLSLADLDVLTAVAEMSAEEHCIRVIALTTRMGWAHSRLSRQLGRMERRGLISRHPCDLDGRGDDITLTQEGQTAYTKASQSNLASIHHHFAEALTPTQLTTLTAIEQSITARRTSP